MKRESKVESFFRKGCEHHGFLAIKLTSPGNDGVPDRLVILPDGRVIFVELKTENGKLSRIQAWQHERFRKHGAKVITVYGDRGASDLIGMLGIIYGTTPRHRQWRDEKEKAPEVMDLKNVYGKQDGKDRVEGGGAR